jgi:hypothetical protein
VYHYLNVAKMKLGPLLVEGHPFVDAFYSCIYGTNIIEEFEICWQHMLQIHAMGDNTHLQNMWKTRMTWSPMYFRHNFFPFTSTTAYQKVSTPTSKPWFVPGTRSLTLCSSMNCAKILC